MPLLTNGMVFATSCLQGQSDALDDTLAESHVDQARLIEKQRAAHERIKKHHHTAMAHVASLDGALKAAM